MKIPKWQHKLVRDYKRGKLVYYFLNSAGKTCLYGPKISENIEIEHVFQPKAFFYFSGNLLTSCLSAFKHPSGRLNGNLTLIFMIRCKYNKKIVICGNISLIIALWVDIFIAFIALNPISTFLRQFYPGDLANFAGSTIVFYSIAALIIDDSTKLLHCRDVPGCYSS